MVRVLVLVLRWPPQRWNRGGCLKGAWPQTGGAGSSCTGASSNRVRGYSKTQLGGGVSALAPQGGMRRRTVLRELRAQRLWRWTGIRIRADDSWVGRRNEG